MKKKFFVVLLAIAAALCLCLGLTACGEDIFSNSIWGTEQGTAPNPEKNDEQKPDHTHSFIRYIYNNDATCIENGTETATCSCGATDTRTKAGTVLGHKMSAENKYSTVFPPFAKYTFTPFFCNVVTMRKNRSRLRSIRSAEDTITAEKFPFLLSRKSFFRPLLVCISAYTSTISKPLLSANFRHSAIWASTACLPVTQFLYA